MLSDIVFTLYILYLIEIIGNFPILNVHSIAFMLKKFKPDGLRFQSNKNPGYKNKTDQ
jgi:hypothetical protein